MGVGDSDAVERPRVCVNAVEDGGTEPPRVCEDGGDGVAERPNVCEDAVEERNAERLMLCDDGGDGVAEWPSVCDEATDFGLVGLPSGRSRANILTVEGVSGTCEE